MSVLTPSEAAAWRDDLERSGRRLVFTSGCFDILHAGHVRYLQQARNLGDALLVALNSDASVRAIKGPERPVNSEKDRAEVLLGLNAVDGVVIFGEPRTTGLIREIQPHIFAKGGDYTVETLNPEERSALEACGAVIHILPELKGRSTTATIQRMRTPESGSSGKVRVAVLGSGAGTNFDAITAAVDAGKLNVDIVLVASDVATAPILEKARRCGIPAQFVDPGPDSARFAPAAQKELADRLRAANVELVVLAGFMRLLKDPVLSGWRSRIVNIHPSLLPAFPGKLAWEQALAAGATQTGCTVHYVDESLDGGPIIAQATVPVLPDDTAESLRLRINAAEQELYPRVLADLVAELRAV